MNLNVWTYIIYLILMAIVIVKVGWMFYKNGQLYIDRLFPGQLDYTNWINKMLLMGYYLVNMGYVAIILIRWQHVPDKATMINSLAATMGNIILLLAVMHYMNLVGLYLMGRNNAKTKFTLNPRNHE